MGWFKNLKKIFGNNESEEYEEYEDYGNSESERREPINGQMETKVTYQYPKGNFRFPLRVEEKSNISTQTSASKIQENNKQHYHQNRQSSSITKNHPNVDKPTERSFNKTVEISTPLEQRQTVQTKIQPKIKQPFRPTEIPSPVYGFRRPPRRNTLNSKNQTNDIHKQEDKDLQLHSDHKSIPTRTDEVKTDNSALKKKIPMKLDKEDQKALHEIEDLLINSEEEVSLQKELWDARNLHTVEQSDLETAFPNSMNQTEIDEQEAEDQYLSEQRHKKEVHTNQLGTMLEERQELQEIISQNINQNQSNIETEIPVEQRDPVVGETKEPQEITDRNIGQKESRIEEEMIVEQRDSVVEEPQESQEVSQNIDQRDSRIEEEMIAEQKDSVVEEPQESQEVSQNLDQRESRRIEEEMIAEQRDLVVEEPQESQEVSQNLNQRESRIEEEMIAEQKVSVVEEPQESQEVSQNIDQRESRIEEEMISEQRDSVVEEHQESQEVSQNLNQRGSRIEEEMIAEQKVSVVEEPQESQEVSQNLNQRESRIEEEMISEQRDSVVEEHQESQEVSQNLNQRGSRIEEEMIAEQKVSVVEEPQESQEVSQNLNQRESRIEEEMISEQRDSVVEEHQESQEVSQNLNQRGSRIEEEMIAEQKDSVVEEPQESQEVSQNLNQRESRIEEEMIAEQRDSVVEEHQESQEVSQNLDQRESRIDGEILTELIDQAVEGSEILNPNQTDKTNEAEQPIIEQSESEEEIPSHPLINETAEISPHLLDENEIQNKEDHSEIPEDKNENGMYTEFKSDSINDPQDIEAENVENDEEMNLKSSQAPVRTHIPFNVIMLKKDREKIEKKQAVAEVQTAQKQTAVTVNTEEYVEEDYVFPGIQLLNPPVHEEMDKDWLNRQSELLDDTLLSFNVRARVVNVSQGPSVTRFEVQPEPGVKVNKITNLSDDIKLSLAAKDIRMEAPIPGKHTIGIELPNAKSRPVYISEIISSEIFEKSESPLTAVLGLDISGSPVITDLRKMPHGLIAGATGSGKSVCINSILISLLYKSTPDQLKLLLIDPKMVELAPYNNIPHLVSPVITDVKAATAALKWAVEEMERRYELFAHTGVREIGRYNEMAEENRQFNQKLPFIVIVIDELADLMMMAPADVEEAICRIAQKARACGIHLIIATQRPSVDVITGLIKANVPTRIAFSVSSQVDSRTIIDISGAEKLLGRGDMLFLGNGTSKPIRLQGTYVSDEEIDQVVAHVRAERKPDYLFEQEELLKKAIIQDEEDEIFHDVCEFVMEQGAASTSLIQRNFRIGYNRAARLMEMMEQQGIISEAKGSKPRDILMSREEYDILTGATETN
ncbi:DNA translocase FtsK [Heyndrickxia camelliae]|nr:DNA translocase FtsK [Heyndrickxia camelliae]